MSYLDRFFEPKGWQSGKFTNADGKQIRYGHIEPEGEKKGTVIITTGYSDYLETYYDTVSEYTARGYAVWAMDWAGQGGSDKKMTESEKSRRLEDHVRDLGQFRRDIVQHDPSQKIFMSTHSMGGQIGLHYLQRHPEDFDFAVIAAPFIDFELSPFARGVLKAVFRTAVDTGFGDKDMTGARKKVTRHLVNDRKKKMKDKAAVRLDPNRTFMLLNSPKRAEDPTFGMIDSLFEASAKMHEEDFLKSIQMPLLIGAAEHDDTINNKAIQRVAGMLPKAEFVFVPDAFHGLWAERCHVRKEWWGHIDAFLEKQDAPPPATAAKSSTSFKPKGP